MPRVAGGSEQARHTPHYGRPVTLPPEPAPAPAEDDATFVRVLSRITIAFCGALVVVGLLGLFVLVPDPVVTLTGLALGLVGGLVSLIVPPLLIRSGLARARRPLEPGDEYMVVRTAVFLGIAFAELPPLVALALVVTDGNHDVGALVLTVPFAIVSLVMNVSGPAALRRHLARVRGASALT